MKAAPFEYVRPDSLAEVCSLLTSSEDARIIAGGQTLVPMLAMRLARPTLLIDVLRIEELRGIRQDDGGVVIGAATRQCEAEMSGLVAESVPLLAQALPWVGHPPTRSRGTVGGSIANGDPSAEIPLTAVTLEAEIFLRTGDETITMSADEFFLGAMFTAAGPDACVTAVRFPKWGGRIGVSFHEVSARKSDFAFVSIAAQVQLDPAGKCSRVALGVGGVEDRPVRLDVDGLVGRGRDQKAMLDLVTAAVEALEASSDLHASADYRKRVAISMGMTALTDAWANALHQEDICR
jgi:CO/xanthine dehydrogenase FAD-binding subunit